MYSKYTLIQLMASLDTVFQVGSGYINWAFLIWSSISTNSLNGNCPDKDT